MSKWLPLKCDVRASRYQAMVGVGGIGGGSFFLMRENHTLGREESRGGRFIDRRDYCKLHIISHYVQVLLGRDFNVIPIGKVGEDDVGRRLREEMVATGMIMRYVTSVPEAQTLFSFCFIYPDGSGGNLTTEDSASAQVDYATLDIAATDIRRYAGHGIVLAVPEVPLAARRHLLELGTENRFFRVASFTSADMAVVRQTDLLHMVDLLAINLDEAAALAGMAGREGLEPQAVVTRAWEQALRTNPALLLSVTGGKLGSWFWDGKQLVHTPVYPVEAVCTAGAGDAYLSGMIAGLVAGLSVTGQQELAGLVAAHAVTSPHTIDDRIDRRTLRALVRQRGATLRQEVLDLLEDGT